MHLSKRNKETRIAVDIDVSIAPPCWSRGQCHWLAAVRINPDSCNFLKVLQHEALQRFSRLTDFSNITLPN